MMTSMHFGTDDGPKCGCGSTVWSYTLHQRYDDFRGALPDVSMTPECKGCHAVGRTIQFGRLTTNQIEALTATTLRKSHERNIKNHESFERDIRARRGAP